MEYLLQEQIEFIHDTFVTSLDQEAGIRNWGILALAAVAPAETDKEGQEFHKTIWDKAAVYMLMIATFQPFNDGNRRTAFASGSCFLRMNGIRFSPSDAPRFFTDIKDQQLSVADIAERIRQESEPRLPKDFPEAFRWFQRKYGEVIKEMRDIS